MRFKIPRLYDSHVHWLGTGQMAVGLQLFGLKKPADIAHIQIEPHYFRGDWLVGFGWDHTKWSDPSLPSKDLLDRVFPHYPVMFQRVDGHCSWLNSLALERLGYECSQGGVLQEEEHFKAYSSLPPLSQEQLRQALERGMQIFNQAGFTHIRDMTCDEAQWQAAKSLDDAGDLTLYVQENFLCEHPRDIDRVLAVLEEARRFETAHLKAQGIKIFFDGTLGSDTAWLSKSGLEDGSNRNSKSNSKNSSGNNSKSNSSCSCATHKFSWSPEDLETLFKKTWSKGFEVAVHTIGDEAAHQVVLAARKVMATNQYTGWFNLEHVEVLRPETISMMKALHVRCHMQPCHWLSDRTWLKEKLGELYKHAFPWGALSKMGIPLYFGSDSPVARCSFWDNQKALVESVKEKIPALKGEITEYHSFPSGGLAETYSVFEGEVLKEIVFDGRVIL